MKKQRQVVKTAGLEADWLPVGQKWAEMGGNGRSYL